MKHILILLIAMAGAAVRVQAHPGGLDKNGGHVDSKTGKYHVHQAPEPKKPEVKKPATKKPEAKKK